MLLSLLSMVAVTLAFPHTDTEGPKLPTYPASKPSTFTPKQENIPTDLTESNTNVTDSEKCQCVPYLICDANDIVGEKYTFTHDSICEGILEVCCKNPKPEQPTTPITKVIRGCGYRNPQGVGSVRSRNLINSGETPWVVALMVGNTTVGAGALVHPQVVMTAAHVADKYSNKTLMVRAGEWHTHTDKQRFQPQERTVKNIKIHKDFINSTLKNDIAILYLEAPMQLADHINVICLPDQDEDFDHSRGCIVNGWGKDKDGAMTLKKVEADILPSESCSAKLKRTRLGKWFQLHKSFLCAEEKKDYTCKGDGGAPLACPGTEVYKVCGLVAWGIGCGDDIPSVYARVAMFREWVDDTMREWGFGSEEWF